MSALAIALVGVTALAAASLQAATGIGFSLVLTPVLFAVLSPTGAVVVATVLGVTLSLLVLLAERRRATVAWSEVGPILLFAIPGTVCGVLILRALSKPVLQVAVGVLVILAAAVRVRMRARQDAPAEGGSGRRAMLGLATGALTTSSGISGPPLALWFSHRGMSPSQVRDSLSACFLGVGVIAALALAPVLGHAHVATALVVVGLVAVVGGHAVGRRAFARLHRHGFEPVLLAVIVLAGTASVVAGLAGM